MYSSIAEWSYSIGLHYTILENSKESDKWIQEAVKNYFISYEMCLEAEGKMTYPMALKLINIVVPTKDQNHYQKSSIFVEKTSQNPYSQSGIFEAYLECMVPLLRGEYDKIPDILPKYRELEHKYWNKVVFFEGLSDCIEGIASNNKIIFLKGLNRILEIFKRRNAREKDIPICPEATTMFILGKRRGLDIKIDDVDEKFRDFIPIILIN